MGQSPQGRRRDRERVWKPISNSLGNLRIHHSSARAKNPSIPCDGRNGSPRYRFNVGR
jgi:hypothetical protein